MSSRGPMTGMNSGMRSMGLATQSPATITAIFALRGTRGSLRSRRTVVTQSGMNAARSRRMPGGSLLARTIRSPQDASSRAMAMPRPVSQSLTSESPFERGVRGGVDLVGVGVEGLRAALEPVFGVDTFGHRKDVAGFEVAPPAAQPVEAVFFLVEFGDGELADPAFFGDLDLEFVALGDELGPLGGAGGVEFAPQRLRVAAAMRFGVEGQHGAVPAASQIGDLGQAVGEHRRGRRPPRAPAERDRPNPAQLPPHGHPMPGGARRYPDDHHQPARPVLDRGHAAECNNRHAH